PRPRFATKKSAAPWTRRPIQRPSAISASEYARRMPRWRFIDDGPKRAALLHVARGRITGNAGRLSCGADDRVGDDLRGERADAADVGGGGLRCRRERE